MTDATAAAPDAQPTEGAETPWPSVSVVIATHNRPELLRRAIAAVVAQEYPGAIELVVVFDKTEPDQTLVSEAPGRTVSVRPNGRTPGLPGGRNTGITHTTGELIAFCDDDDEWLPGKLLAQVRHLRAHPDVTFCTTGIVIDFEGQRTERPSRVEELTVESLVHDRLTEAHPSTFVFRRSAIERFGLVDEEIPGGYSEDYDFLIRAARDGRIACLPTPYVSVRWGRTSYFTTRWQTIVDAQRYMLAKHPEFGQHRKAEARLRGQIAFALAALGHRRDAVGEIGRVLRTWPLEKRWPVAIAVASKVVSPERALSLAHRTGRGI